MQTSEEISVASLRRSVYQFRTLVNARKATKKARITKWTAKEACCALVKTKVAKIPVKVGLSTNMYSLNI